jgi:hypothetical protein
MAMDPEDLVTLTDHGTMKLRSAVARAMMLPAKERKMATIVREGVLKPPPGAPAQGLYSAAEIIQFTGPRVQRPS